MWLASIFSKDHCKSLDWTVLFAIGDNLPLTNSTAGYLDALLWFRTPPRQSLIRTGRIRWIRGGHLAKIIQRGAESEQHIFCGTKISEFKGTQKKRSRTRHDLESLIGCEEACCNASWGCVLVPLGFVDFRPFLGILHQCSESESQSHHILCRNLSWVKMDTQDIILAAKQSTPGSILTGV